MSTPAKSVFALFILITNFNFMSSQRNGHTELMLSVSEFLTSLWLLESTWNHFTENNHHDKRKCLVSDGWMDDAILRPFEQ